MASSRVTGEEGDSASGAVLFDVYVPHTLFGRNNFALAGGGFDRKTMMWCQTFGFDSDDFARARWGDDDAASSGKEEARDRANPWMTENADPPPLSSYTKAIAPIVYSPFTWEQQRILQHRTHRVHRDQPRMRARQQKQDRPPRRQKHVARQKAPQQKGR